MAIHDFTCDGCNITIHDTDTRVHICPQCGKEMRWDFGSKGITVHGNYLHPIHSDALAIHPSQRAEHEREFPNIRLDGQNRPIFDNFTNHENYLKKTGFVKERQKIKSGRKK